MIKINIKRKLIYYIGELIDHIGNLVGRIKSIGVSFHQVVYWLPIIWRNNWWDYQYLLILMEHQLDLMAKHWVVNTRHENDERVKVEIIKMRDNLRVIINNEFYVDEPELIATLTAIKNDFDKIPSWWD